MKDKNDIVANWLPRYTGAPLDAFGDHVLLTNFGHYVELFAEANAVPVLGRDKPMPNATADGITMINFGMGSPNAATVMDLLSAIARVSDRPYRWKIVEAPLSKVANVEKMLPRDFISKDGYGITAKARAYLGPLMRGEAPPPFKDGLPRYVRLKNAPVAKKLPTDFKA